MVGGRFFDDRVGDVEPELVGGSLEDLGEAPALERRCGPLPELRVDGSERCDQLVLAGRIETMSGEAPEIEEVRATQVPRGEGSTPVEDHSRHCHEAETLYAPFGHVCTRPDGGEK